MRYSSDSEPSKDCQAHKNSIIYLVTIWRRSEKWERKKELWELINPRRLSLLTNPLGTETVYSLMKAWSAITCWPRHWIIEPLNPWTLNETLLVDSRSSLVLENRVTSFHYYNIKSMLIISRTETHIILVKEMNRHWSIFTHLVTDQKTRIIQLRRNRLSKRRILLRNDRSILLNKKNSSIERIERLNSFLSWYQSIQHSLLRMIIKAKINSSSRFTETIEFSKQTNVSFFFSSQSNFLINLY